MFLKQDEGEESTFLHEQATCLVFHLFIKLLKHKKVSLHNKLDKIDICLINNYLNKNKIHIINKIFIKNNKIIIFNLFNII